MSYDCAQKLQTKHQLLAKSLPNLSAVAFKLECVKPGSLVDPEWCRSLVSSSRRTETVSMMLMLVRPFKHIMEVNFIYWRSLAYTDDMYPVDSPGVPWEDLFLDCAGLLEEERELLVHPFKSSLNVYVENGTMERSIWEPERFYNSSFYLCNCFRCPLG
jgi:hypothetical protein